MRKVTVITINYNNAAGLEKTVKSVIDQSYNDFEFIVVDGGSTDSSLNVIDNYKDKITRWVSERDRGIYHAQNKGILMATGEYCLFLNSGDILADELVLKKIVPELSSVDILYGDIITLNDKGNKTYLSSPPKFDSYQLMISTLWHPSAFIKRSIFNTFGMYNEDFKVTGDYEFFIRTILKHGVSTRYVRLAVTIFNLGGISNTSEMQNVQTSERRKSWELNFSNVVIEAFEDRTKMLRSREYKLGKLAIKILRPFMRK